MYIRPKSEPLGQVWPQQASYLFNYQRLNNTGLSSVTVDNSQNDSDIFVKIAALSNNAFKPVRVFYIPAFGRFKVSNLDVGLYDLRYRDLESGRLQKSDSFSLYENEVNNGREFSDMTLTIYRVINGNMDMHALSESDF